MRQSESVIRAGSYLNYHRTDNLQKLFHTLDSSLKSHSICQRLPQNEGVLDLLKSIFYIVVINLELLRTAIPHL